MNAAETTEASLDDALDAQDQRLGVAKLHTREATAWVQSAKRSLGRAGDELRSIRGTTALRQRIDVLRHLVEIEFYRVEALLSAEGLDLDREATTGELQVISGQPLTKLQGGGQ